MVSAEVFRLVVRTDFLVARPGPALRLPGRLETRGGAMKIQVKRVEKILATNMVDQGDS